MIKMRPAVYANHKRKDGSYPVKIVVYFKGKERKLPTNIVCQPQHLTRALKLKQAEPLFLAQDQIIKMQAACADLTSFDLEYRDVDFVVNHIKNKLSKQVFRLDFFQFADQFVEGKKEGTRARYVQALNALERFIGKREIDVNLITHTMVAQFAEFLDNEPHIYWNVHKGKHDQTKQKKAAGGQAYRHVAILGAIFKAAKKKYNDEDAEQVMIPRSPFENHELSVPAAVGQKPLPQEVIQKLISAQTEVVGIRSAIDVAVVSFGLMGANLADLYEAQNPNGEWWVYNRRKTRDRRPDKAEMRVRVPECLAPYIARLKGRKRGCWLGRLHEMAADGRHITQAVNNGLARWCEAEGVERFTMYALRKSWGTIARRIGVDKSVVDEGLAHVGDYRMTDIYAERPWEKINEANSKVLALFDWD